MYNAHLQLCNKISVSFQFFEIFSKCNFIEYHVLSVLSRELGQIRNAQLVQGGHPLQRDDNIVPQKTETYYWLAVVVEMLDDVLDLICPILPDI